jgi:hypothetical protein
MALINGRELFGYPKYLCEYEIPAAGGKRCAAPWPPRASSIFAGNKLALHPLLEVNATVQTGQHKVNSFLELIEQAFQMFLSIPDFFNMDQAGWADIMSLLRNPRIDQIFLKQFPDSAGVKAVYQALVARRPDQPPAQRAKCWATSTNALHAFDSFPLDPGPATGAAGGHPAVQRELRFHRACRARSWWTIRRSRRRRSPSSAAAWAP